MDFNLTITDYTEKTIVVRGKTAPFKIEFSKPEYNGKFNPSLLNGPGWVFAKIKQKDVQSLLDKIKSGEVLPLKRNGILATSDDEEKTFDFTQKEYLALISRIERLEQIACLAGWSLTDVGKNTTKAAPATIGNNTKERDNKDEEVPLQRGLLRKARVAGTK